MKKGIKVTIGVVIAGIVIFNSVYFRPLDEKLADTQEVEFDAISFVDGLWTYDLTIAYDSSIEINQLLKQFKQDIERTFQEESNTLGIGNIGYFKVMGEGIVQEVNENNVIIKVGEQSVEIETEFIFGNAVRDASGLIRINDFVKTSDFNSISEAINDKIRKEVIPDFRANVKNGNKILFKGALELNRTHLKLTQPEVIPVFIQILP